MAEEFNIEELREVVQIQLKTGLPEYLARAMVKDKELNFGQSKEITVINKNETVDNSAIKEMLDNQRKIMEMLTKQQERVIERVIIKEKPEKEATLEDIVNIPLDIRGKDIKSKIKDLGKIETKIDTTGDSLDLLGRLLK